MRIIKQQDQKTVDLQKIRYSGEMPVSGSPLPAWMQAAASESKLPAQCLAADIGQLEKAAFEKGRQEAEQSALEAADRKIAGMMKQYADALVEIGRVKRVVYAQAEREVVRLALEVAKKIVHREVRVDPQILQTLVRVALDHVASKAAVTVHVNPADYSFLLEQQGGTGGSLDGGVVFVADRSVDRGGFLIETECGDIDGRIEEEFREVEHAFFGSEEQEP